MLGFISPPNVYATRRQPLTKVGFVGPVSESPAGAPEPSSSAAPPSATPESQANATVDGQDVTLQVDNTYILNIFLNTVLFLFTLISGTVFTSAMTAAVNRDPGWRRLALFALFFTAATMGIAIGFASISRHKHTLQIQYLNGLSL